MPMARELLPGMGEQTLKDEVKKMGGALNKPVLFLSNTSEETKITRSNPQGTAARRCPEST